MGVGGRASRAAFGGPPNARECVPCSGKRSRTTMPTVHVRGGPPRTAREPRALPGVIKPHIPLDGPRSKNNIPRVFRQGPLLSSTRPLTLCVLALSSLAIVAAHAATPFTQATVTRLQNRVSFGEIKGDQSVLRPAAPQDVVRAMNFLQSETDSRAELRYEDGSLVRIGQNTIFSFEANTRTLTLTKGSFIFYVPKGSGGGVIKTPSLTAAITGTVGKVSRNYIAILEGVVKLIPSGRTVSAGQFARFNADGTITIDFFPPATALDGVLVNWNGPMPGLDEQLFAGQSKLPKPDFSSLDSFQRTQNDPAGLKLFNPQLFEEPPPVILPEKRTFVPPPQNRPPTNNDRGGRPRY